eukprot:296746-Chlamydomonas_euryale.AAC.5
MPPQPLGQPIMPHALAGLKRSSQSHASSLAALPTHPAGRAGANKARAQLRARAWHALSRLEVSATIAHAGVKQVARLRQNAARRVHAVATTFLSVRAASWQGHGRGGRASHMQCR